jgi:UDP-N-acetylmuramyl pentapeptide phosphotransferase/UDP-N-acetylglucosamine-1-phosphate transferase
MKPATILGLTLILLGVVAFSYQGITYTTREKIIDIGSLQATVDKKETIPLTPLVGGLALVGGIVLLIVGARRA